MQIPLPDNLTIARLVRHATGAARLEVSDWAITRIHSGGGEAAGVYRVGGNATGDGIAFPWALILKVLQPGAASAQPSRWNNEQREALAYGSGLLDGIGGGLSAPRCFETSKRDDGTTWLWLEDVGRETQPVWPIARYGLAAYHLGRFNGSYRAGETLPAHSWLSRRWLRGWIEEASPFLDMLPQYRNHPAVRQIYDVDHILRLWAERNRRLDYLEGLPQTLCHLDAYRGNLFARSDALGQEQTVAIDWAFVGLAAFGEELASLVAATVAVGHIPPESMRELEATVLSGSLDGLSDAGCHVDPQLVSNAYAVSASIRLPVGALRLVLPVILNPGQHQEIQQQHGGTPLADLRERWGAMNLHLRVLG